MNILDEIYGNICLSDIDYRQVHSMEVQVNILAKKFADSKGGNSEDMSELLLEACSCGEKTGFIIGFRYALMLMSQCYF